MLLFFLALFIHTWSSQVYGLPAGDLLVHHQTKRSLVHRSADNTIDIAASGNVPILYSTQDIVDLLGITTNVHPTNVTEMAVYMEKRGLSSCGIGASIWKVFSNWSYSSWLWYAAGALVNLPDILDWSTRVVDSSTRLLKAVKTFKHTYDYWTPNNGADPKRTDVSVKFDLAGSLGANLTVHPEDYGVTTYFYDSATGIIEQLGITTASPPVYATTGAKRNNWYSLVSAFSPYGSFDRINYNDLAYVVKDMMHATWDQGGESCFSEQWSQETSKDFYTEGGFCAQLSTYSNNDVNNLWGNCCGVNRGAPWTDCGWAAYDNKGDGCNGN